MGLTVRELMKKLSHENPESPVAVISERLFYDRNGVLDINATERNPVGVSDVTVDAIKGTVVIE